MEGEYSQQNDGKDIATLGNRMEKHMENVER